MPRQLNQLVAVLAIVSIGLLVVALLLQPFAAGHARAAQEADVVLQIAVGDNLSEVTTRLDAVPANYQFGHLQSGETTISVRSRTLVFDDATLVKIHTHQAR